METPRECTALWSAEFQKNWEEGGWAPVTLVRSDFGGLEYEECPRSYMKLSPHLVTVPHLRCCLYDVQPDDNTHMDGHIVYDHTLF